MNRAEVSFLEYGLPEYYPSNSFTLAELAQVAVLEAYLPKQMSNEELEAALKEIIAEVGAAGPQDMGKVMGVATKKLAGKAEGRAISAKVKELLGIGEVRMINGKLDRVLHTFASH